MIKVETVLHPLSFENRAIELELKLQDIERRGSTILHVTSDNEGYTIVYRTKDRKLHS